jgi:2-polyprenyl-6-methoxyphenol hydroxylase-like FAD-dependent oxidoreductase
MTTAKTTAAKEFDVPVVVAGAGPVGLTLAMDLAWRGINVVVLETRRRGEPPEVKCNHVSARSMEIFRRLGVAGKLRNAGLPADYPADVSYRTSFTGRELSRIPIPCRRDRYAATDGPDCDWPTPEPPHRINQIYIEPILFDHAAQMRGVEILNRTALEDYSQDDEGVTVLARDLDTEEILRIHCRYLAGCDGGKSMVRRSIGARLEGDAIIQRVQSTYIRAPELLHESRQKPAWATFAFNPRRCGNVYAIDGIETWVVHNYLEAGENHFEAVDRDRAIRTILGVDDDFAYEIIAKMDWYGRRFVADRFRDRRVFICGDAAHLWVPFAGYGMNAGIADAMNLSWLLAAHLNGWASAGILAAYERERQPITEQVSRFAMDHCEKLKIQRDSVPANIEEDSPAGESARAALGDEAYRLNVQQYCCGGLNFGYFYDNSPIIAHDGSAPPYTMAEFTPSTVPGCRLPHFPIGNGRSLYDALGPEFTLLRRDPSLDVATLCNAAASRKLPLCVLDIGGAEAVRLYDHKLVLARPDQHIAWRGDAPPAAADELIALVSGGQP